MYWGRLWKELNISRLTCIIYPTRHPAYNLIQHAWSPMSNALTLVIVATLPTEVHPPNRQTCLAKDELENNTAIMLNNASNTLKEYWDNLTYDANPVIPIPMTSKNESSKYKDDATVKKLVNATVKNLESNEEPFALLRKEFKFYCRHINRRRSFLSVIKRHFFKNDDQECQECRNSSPSNCKEFKFEENWDLIFLRPSYTSYMMDISKHILK